MRLVRRKRDFEGMDLTEEIGIELAVGALGSKYMIDGDVQRVIDGNDSLLPRLGAIRRYWAPE